MPVVPPEGRNRHDRVPELPGKGQAAIAATGWHVYAGEPLRGTPLALLRRTTDGGDVDRMERLRRLAANS